MLVKMIEIIYYSTPKEVEKHKERIKDLGNCRYLGEGFDEVGWYIKIELNYKGVDDKWKG